MRAALTQHPRRRPFRGPQRRHRMVEGLLATIGPIHRPAVDDDLIIFTARLPGRDLTRDMGVATGNRLAIERCGVSDAHRDACKAVERT